MNVSHRQLVTRRFFFEECGIGLYYRKQLGRLEAGELNGSEIAGTDRIPKGRRLEELAAWTTAAKALLNLDETITKE